LFNGETSINEGLVQTQESFVDNFWEILPIEKIDISKDIITVGGIENTKFLKSEEKAAKTIQKHSMLIENVQYNSKIAQAYLLLGRARYFDQRFIPALDAFNQVYKQNLIVDEWYHSVIWKAKCNIRLEQEDLAIELLKTLLKKEKLSSKLKADANAALAMAYLQLQKNDLAIKPLKTAFSNEKNKHYKARYLYILGQIYEEKTEKDSAFVTFKKIASFKRSIPRNFFINAKLKAFLYDPLNNNEAAFLKIIDNIENEPFLDKIYYGYSKILFSKDSISKAVSYLNKAIKENTSDKNLLSRGYEQLSELSFKKHNYVLSGKYLDSTLNNLDKNSKKYWELNRRKKGLDRVVKLEENIVLYDSLIKLSSYEPSKLNEVLNQIEVKAQKPKTKNQIEIRNVDKARYRNNTKTNFYFYDVKLVELGKKSFQTIWGQRTRESYWRSVSTKVMPEAAKKEEPASSSEELEKIELDNQGLLLTIPRTNFQKDSINRLKNKSYLRLAEIYLEKYKDYPLTESKLNQLMSLSPAKDVLAEANYLLYKSQKKQNKKEAKKIRLEIIKKFPSSKFAKILKDRNNLIVEEKETLSELDSLQLLYNNQKFEQVLSELEKKMVFIENKEILFEFDLLKAQTIGRLEGVLKYNEQIKNMIDRYPNSPGTIDLKILSRAISIKWQTKPKKTTIGNYNIVFKLSNSQSLKDALSKTIKKIKKITLNKYRVSVDVYDSSIKLIVVTGLKSKENANELSDNIKEELEFLKLNNNFVVLSSEYKNMLIYKTLDLD
jgi:tetratricopeptide (TPR) repeat protein|tara:strand:+ start:644 stop:2971 length:2328 start_codon:yes stop_codon:yes gene_type:complete